MLKELVLSRRFENVPAITITVLFESKFCKKKFCIANKSNNPNVPEGAAKFFGTATLLLEKELSEKIFVKNFEI